MEERIKIENEWYIKESAIYKYVKTESSEIKESDIHTSLSRLYEDSDLWVEVVVDPVSLTFIYCEYKDKTDKSAKEQGIDNNEFMKTLIYSPYGFKYIGELELSEDNTRKLKNIFTFLVQNKYVVL